MIYFIVYDCSEVCVISVRASVIVYDDVSKKWVPGGHSQGLSKVQIYQHMEKNTFRVVGRKLQDHEVKSSSCAHDCNQSVFMALVFVVFLASVRLIL